MKSLPTQRSNCLMKNKEYTIEINAPQDRVWDIMLSKDTYAEWVKGFAENSLFVGEWTQGTHMDFIHPNHGGTRATLDIVDRPHRLQATHIALISKDGSLDTTSEFAKTWIGTVEEYILQTENDTTHVTIVMHFHPDYEDMLDKGWKKSLQFLKALCETNT